MRIYPKGNTKYYIDNIYSKYWGKPRPKNVENQIKRYWETTDTEKRKIIYQLIELEWVIAEYGKL